jgi:hypothetical protein
MADICVQEVPLYGFSSTPGYNDGVSLITEATADTFVRFDVSLPVGGIVAGYTYQDATGGIVDIAFGFQFSGTQVRVVEGGAVRTSYQPALDSYDYIVLRAGDQIAYVRRPKALQDWVDSGAQSIWFDDRMPGIPLPGEPIYVSIARSTGILFFDSSFYGVGDKLCLLDFDTTTFISDNALSYDNLGGIFGSYGTLVGNLGITGSGAGSVGAAVLYTSQVQGLLPFTLRGDLIYNPADATLDGQLGLEGFATGSATADPAANALIYGDLPLIGFVAGSVTSDPAITATLDGELPLVADLVGSEIGAPGPVGGALQGVLDGKLYINGYGAKLTGQLIEASGFGYLTFEGTATGSIAQEQNQSSGILGLLMLTGVGIANGYAYKGVSEGELPLVGNLAGRATADAAITATAQWDLGLEGTANGSAEYNNYISIVLPEIIGASSGVGYDEDIYELLLAASEVQSRLVLLVREFVQLVTTLNTFSTQTTELLDTAYAVATAIPGYSLLVQETFDITGTLDVLQVIELADAILAAGMVQTRYQGVVAVLSAVLISDGGAGADPVGSGAILDSNGVSGDPAQIALYGWFPTGSVIGISYVTNIGSGSVSYTLIAHQTGEQVAERLVALLDAEFYISSTYAGSGVIEILPANGATVVDI